MPWSLEIHHLDVNSNGDATLIVARNDGTGVGELPQVRSVLIDGGKKGAESHVFNYLKCTPGVGSGPAARLNLMVATHYDADHFFGLIELLAKNDPILSALLVLDQGKPAVNEVSYVNYCNAIASQPGRVRVTATVYSDPQMPRNALPGGWQYADWLLGKEILWTDNTLTPSSPAALIGAPAGTNADPPTVRCIAVNQCVLGGGANNPIAGLGFDPKNERSLAFVVEFHGFRYYIGGDITTAQENFLQTWLNPDDDPDERVLVLKASHHGANTATSRQFVSRLRPEAVVISCGANNQFRHPAQETVNILAGYAPLQPAVWGLAFPPQPPLPPSRPISYYMTGFQRYPGDTLAPPVTTCQSRGGDTALTAGDPRVPGAWGDVLISVSAQQAAADPRGQQFLTVCAALTALDPNLATAGLAAGNATIDSGDPLTAAAAAAALVVLGVPPGPSPHAPIVQAAVQLANAASVDVNAAYEYQATWTAAAPAPMLPAALAPLGLPQANALAALVQSCATYGVCRAIVNSQPDPITFQQLPNSATARASGYPAGSPAAAALTLVGTRMTELTQPLPAGATYPGTVGNLQTAYGGLAAAGVSPTDCDELRRAVLLATNWRRVQVLAGLGAAGAVAAQAITAPDAMFATLSPPGAPPFAVAAATAAAAVAACYLETPANTIINAAVQHGLVQAAQRNPNGLFDVRFYWTNSENLDHIERITHV